MQQAGFTEGFKLRTIASFTSTFVVKIQMETIDRKG